MYRCLFTLWVLLGVGAGAAAQNQSGFAAWYFGNHAALKFIPGQAAPTPVPGSAMRTFEACAAVADAQGDVLFYTDAETIWNRQHGVMTNGAQLGGNASASSGALVVRAVGAPERYYVFTLDSKENNLRNGFRYSVVDMTLDGGLGAVTQKGQPITLPNGALPTEHLTAIPHANGLGYWIVVHGFENDQFYAYHLTAAGLASAPVVSAIGSVYRAAEQGQTGIIRAAPSAHQLAASKLLGGLELFDFDPATGRLSNASVLIENPAVTIASPQELEKRVMGVEFSSDGTLLYTHQGAAILQFDLQAGSPAAVQASRRVLGGLNNYVGHFLRGPDQRIYIAALNEPRLSVIDQANSILGATFTLRGVAIADRWYATSQYGLPNFLTSPVISAPIPVQDDLRLVLTPACAGSASRFSGELRGPQRSFQRITWTVLPEATVYTGVQVAPVFTQPGVREVRIEALLSDGTLLTQTRQIIIPAPPTLRLRAATAGALLTCGEPGIQLSAVTSEAGTLQWSDDASAPATRNVSQPGIYRAQFRSAAGCVVTDSITVLPPASPCALPNIITPNGDQTNQRLVMPGYVAENWDISIYNRWGRLVYQQANYQNDWQAEGQPAGTYYYQLRHRSTHQLLKGWVEVVR